MTDLTIVKYDCFTSNLNNYGNLVMSYENFDDIYSALIYAYKKSFVEFTPNVPNKNQFYPGYQCKSIINKFTTIYYDGQFPYQNKIQEVNFPIIVYHDKIRKAIFIQRKFRKHLKRRLEAALLIQKHLRKAIANPYTKLCRRRLLREFNEM